jgi:hypothetical protein
MKYTPKTSIADKRHSGECGRMATRNSDYEVYLTFGEAELGNPAIDEVSCHSKDCSQNQQHHKTATSEFEWKKQQLP